MWARLLCVVTLLVCTSAARSLVGVVSSNSYSNSVSSQGSCVRTQNGRTGADLRSYVYELEPLRTEFDVPIRDFQGCRKVGVSVAVCGRSAAASVRLQDLSHAYVRRTGDVSTPGLADIVVYCG